MYSKEKFRIEIQKISDQKITYYSTNHNTALTDWLKDEQFLVRCFLDLDLLLEFFFSMYMIFA